MAQSLAPLPIDPLIPELVASLATARSAVLRATPGSGKTTRVPPALLQAPWRARDSEILVLEPRRLAAKWAARRVAEELSIATGARSEVGKLVGYQFRFENVTSRETRLRFLTEGMLMRRLLGDPRLERVAAVVLDEFHERHLHGDIALAWLRALQRGSRPDLRIVVMSATLDTESVSRFLGDAPVFDVQTRQHAVDVEYLRSAPARGLEIAVRDAIVATRERPGPAGDTLVFLPGMAEIRRCEQTIVESGAARGAYVLPLHGELTREEQDRAILKADRPKIILATNVAETSLTIDGVTTVIDSGLHRIGSYSHWSGVPALRTRAISRASAIQRAGRAGRTGPGRCLRLYTQGDFDGRAAFEVPEIQRADITQTLLELKSLGIADPARFGWFEPPTPTALAAGLELLRRLGALDPAASGGVSQGISPMGRWMACIPAHPRVARLLIEGKRQGCLEDAATLAAAISETALDRSGQIDAEAAIEGLGRDEGLRRARSQLVAALPDEIRAVARPHRAPLAFAALSAYPDRVARKRAETELQLSAGGSARVDIGGGGATGLRGEWFVVLDIQETRHLGQARSATKARSLVSIEPDWLLDLDPPALEEREEMAWDPNRKRVTARTRLACGELVVMESERSALDESTGEPRDAGAATRMLLKAGVGIDPARAPVMDISEWMAALGPLSESAAEIEPTLARLALAQKHGLVALAAGDPATVAPWAWIEPVLAGKTSLAELRGIDWPSAIIAASAPGLAHGGPRSFGELLPTQVALGGGRRARVQYSLSLPPWVEARMQDFMGLRAGPCVLGGQVPLAMHLLAPNMRAVQVTVDLAGFWEREYPRLRKELGRRYPRTPWPEDPLVALPPREPRPARR